jgi:hypothetical protein
MHNFKYARQRQIAISKVSVHKCNGKYNTLKAKCANNGIFWAWFKNRMANPGNMWNWQKMC